jgi:mannosyltransferase OCH1-like enzyme
MYRYGGVYLDIDFECLKNVEELLTDIECFTACEEIGTVSCGIFGAHPSHQVFKIAMELLPQRMEDESLWQSQQTGPGLFAAAIDQFGRDKVVLFGPELFYPYHWKEKHRRNEEFPDAYAVHHWYGSWVEDGERKINEFYRKKQAVGR